MESASMDACRWFLEGRADQDERMSGAFDRDRHVHTGARGLDDERTSQQSVAILVQAISCMKSRRDLVTLVSLCWFVVFFAF